MKLLGKIKVFLFSILLLAFGSIRMEPVFMVLGQSAAIAASLAVDGKLAVQDVNYGKLH